VSRSLFQGILAGLGGVHRLRLSRARLRGHRARNPGGKNWRNLKVLVFVLLLFAANVVFHIEAHIQGSATYGRRFGIAAAIALVMLIGGRVIPSFTHSYLAAGVALAACRKHSSVSTASVLRHPALRLPGGLPRLPMNSWACC